MGVVLKFGEGEKVNIADLPLSVIEQVEEATERSWFEIEARPFATAKSTRVLFDKVAAHMGFPPIELTMATFPDHFEVTPADDDRPTEYQDGLPLTEGESPQTS